MQPLAELALLAHYNDPATVLTWIVVVFTDPGLRFAVRACNLDIRHTDQSSTHALYF